MHPDTTDDRQAKAKKGSRLSRLTRFGLRTLLVVVAFCAVLLAWWRDRSQLQQDLRQSELLRQMTLPEDDERILLEMRLLRELEMLEPDRPSPPRHLELGESARDRLGDIVSRLGHTETSYVRVRAAAGLRQFRSWGADEAVTDLAVSVAIRLLKDDPLIRKEAILALGELGPRAARAIESLRPGLDDEQPAMAAYTAWALWWIDPTLDLSPRVEELLQNEEAEARKWAAYAVAFHGQARTVPLLIGMLHDADPDARLLAAYGIMNVASKQEALHVLAGAMASEENPRVRSCIRIAIQLLELGRGCRQPHEIEADFAALAPPPPAYQSGPTPPPPEPQPSRRTRPPPTP